MATVNCLYELPEQGADPVRRNPDAGVPYLEVKLRGRVSAVLHAQRNADFAALGELDGIAEKVDQDLTQSSRITEKVRHRCRIDIHDKLKPLLRRAQCHGIDRLVYDFPDVELDNFQFELACFNLGHIQDVTDEIKQ